MPISDNLKKAMEYRGIQASELSAKSGVPAPRISEIISGKTANPRFKTLEKLSRALGMTVTEITNGEIKKQPGRIAELHEKYHRAPEEELTVFESEAIRIMNQMPLDVQEEAVKRLHADFLTWLAEKARKAET